MPDLITLEGKKAFAGQYAAKHLLDTALVCAVIEQESEWNTWAVRAEPEFKARYIDRMNLTPTQSWTRSMSFGLMQIMGQTAIEFGFTGKYLTELCDPDMGTEYGCRKLRRCLDLHAEKADALLAYNGGSDPSYSKNVLSKMASYY